MTHGAKHYLLKYFIQCLRFPWWSSLKRFRCYSILKTTTTQKYNNKTNVKDFLVECLPSLAQGWHTRGLPSCTYQFQSLICRALTNTLGKVLWMGWVSEDLSPSFPKSLFFFFLAHRFYSKSCYLPEHRFPQRRQIFQKKFFCDFSVSQVNNQVWGAKQRSSL